MSDATQEQIRAALQELPGWSHEKQALHKSFNCKNFREAISWIVRLSFYAEEQDHHPEITNVYGRIDLALSTHSAGGRVTEKDVALARAIEAFNWV